MPAFLPSELPVRAVARHHWLVLLRPPGRWSLLGVVILAVLAWIRPTPFAWLAAVVLLLAVLFRWRLWRADRVYLTGLRVIEVSGVPELTRSERFLRLDRIAGAEIVVSGWGRMFGFATIELTAPGDRVDVRRFAMIADADRFYRTLRALALGEPGIRQDDFAGEYDTDPLPDLERHGHDGWDGHDGRT